MQKKSVCVCTLLYLYRRTHSKCAKVEDVEQIREKKEEKEEEEEPE